MRKWTMKSPRWHRSLSSKDTVRPTRRSPPLRKHTIRSLTNCYGAVSVSEVNCHWTRFRASRGYHNYSSRVALVFSPRGTWLEPRLCYLLWLFTVMCAVYNKHNAVYPHHTSSQCTYNYRAIPKPSNTTSCPILQSINTYLLTPWSRVLRPL
jgi:hypothetical protein